VLERYEYDAFGSEQLFDGNYNALATSGIGNHILYTGRTKDSEIDKYYYRARHYSDYNGRFEQRDPLQYFAGDMNLYAYVF
jgi:RHS repeat-associated protein